MKFSFFFIFSHIFFIFSHFSSFFFIFPHFSQKKIKKTLFLHYFTKILIFSILIIYNFFSEGAVFMIAHIEETIPILISFIGLVQLSISL